MEKKWIKYQDKIKIVWDEKSYISFKGEFKNGYPVYSTTSFFGECKEIDIKVLTLFYSKNSKWYFDNDANMSEICDLDESFFPTYKEIEKYGYDNYFRKFFNSQIIRLEKLVNYNLKYINIFKSDKKDFIAFMILCFNNFKVYMPLEMIAMILSFLIGFDVEEGKYFRKLYRSEYLFKMISLKIEDFRKMIF